MMLATSTRDRLTELVHRDRSSQSEEPELDSGRLDQGRRRLIDHSQIVDLILSCPELLDDADVLDQTPHSEDWDRESDRAGKEMRELGKREVNRGAVQLVDKGGSSSLRRDGQELIARHGRNERRVLQQMPQDPASSAQRSAVYPLVTHTLQRVGVQEAKVTRVDDGSSLMLADQAVQFVVCASAVAKVDDNPNNSQSPRMSATQRMRADDPARITRGWCVPALRGG